MDRGKYYILFAPMKNGDGMAKIFTNLRRLSAYSGLSYDTLLNHFVRSKKVWVEYPKQKVTVIKIDNRIVKGLQKVERAYKGHNRNI